MKNSRKPQKDRCLLRSRKDRPQKCKDFFIDRKDHACFVDKVVDRNLSHYWKYRLHIIVFFNIFF